MSATQNAKQVLRKNMKQALHSLSELYVKEQSSIILKKLLEMDWYRNSGRIGVYLSTKKEVQTDDIIHNILLSNKCCYIPWYNKDVMKLVKLESAEELATLPLTKWNIRQPLDISNKEDAVASGGLDLILVPGLGFTRQGKRLGHGKGYYDKFLSELLRNTSRTARTVGLAFNEQILEDVPCSEHDFVLDMVLTPN